MMQTVGEIATADTCTSPGGDAPGDEDPRQSPNNAGLFQRQLAAAGLEAVAEKVAAGTALDFDDMVVLSRASLPLLGRIVRLIAESCARNTGFSRNGYSELSAGNSPPTTTPAEGHTTNAALPIDCIDSGEYLPRQIAQPLADWETFCRELLATRRELEAANEHDMVLWFPKVADPPDMHSVADGEFTGVDVLRAIALARLMLPARVQISAPLAALGPKLAQVALEFGASHLGFVANGTLASDGHLPGSPLVADRSVVDELRGSCSPTRLKEDL